MYNLRVLSKNSTIVPILPNKPLNTLHKIFVRYNGLRNLLVEAYEKPLNDLLKDPRYKQLKVVSFCELDMVRRLNLGRELSPLLKEYGITRKEMQSTIEELVNKKEEYLDSNMLKDIVDDVYYCAYMVTLGLYASLYYSLEPTGIIRLRTQKDTKSIVSYYDSNVITLFNEDFELANIYSNYPYDEQLGLLCTYDKETEQYRYYFFTDGKPCYVFEEYFYE